jgi:hypothetical protein
VAVIPPIVQSHQVGGSVYLLEWQQLNDGAWGAEVAWWEWDGQRWVGRRAHVMADDLTRIEGQNYGSVPRIKLAEMLRRDERRRKGQS